MNEHLLNQLVVGPTSFPEPRLGIGSTFLAQQLARSQRHSLQQVSEGLFIGWWSFQVLDDGRFDACVANQGERVAGRAAAGMW